MLPVIPSLDPFRPQISCIDRSLWEAPAAATAAAAAAAASDVAAA